MGVGQIRLASAGIVALYLALTLLCFDQIEEDAFIYFRFAANLADGYGYVFNRAGPPVESGSSLPWQLLLTLLSLLPGDIVVKAKLLGIAFGAGALLLCGRLAARVLQSPHHALLPPLLLALSPPFYAWAQRGLESAFYLCCVLAAAVCACDPRWRRGWWLAALAVAAGRPEGPLIALGLAPFVVHEWRRGHAPLRGLALLGLGLLALVGFRLAYFHDLVPHPFYVKMRGGDGLGALALASYLGSSHVLWLALPAAAGALRRRFWGPESALVLGFASVTLVWFLLSADYKPYHRHLLPALPFLFVLCVHGLAELAAGRAPAWLMPAAVCGFAALLMLPAGSTIQFDRPIPNPAAAGLERLVSEPGAFGGRILDVLREPHGSPPAGTRLAGLHDEVGINYQATAGKFIRDNYRVGTRFVHDQMGQTPWYAGLDKTAIDSFGLLDRRVGLAWFAERSRQSAWLGAWARLMNALSGALWPDEPRPGSLEDAADHVFAAEPDLILVTGVLVWASPDEPPARIEEDRRLRQRYRPRFLLNGLIRVYERRDLPTRDDWVVPEFGRVDLLKGFGPPRPGPGP